jgi:hypothetical protein
MTIVFPFLLSVMRSFFCIFSENSDVNMTGMLQFLDPVFLKRCLRHMQLTIILHILCICSSGRPSFCFRRLSQDYVFLEHEVPLLPFIVSC